MEESKEQDKSMANLICFNPSCPNSKNRFFKTTDSHYTQKECKVWFHQINDLLGYDKHLLSNMKNDKTKGILFDFAHDPIEALKKLASLNKLNWKHSISLMFDQVGQQISQQLDFSQKLMIQQIQRSLTNASIYESIIKVLAIGANGESTSRQLTDLLQKTKIPTQSVMIFNPQIPELLISDIKQAFGKTNEALTNMKIIEKAKQILEQNGTSQKTDFQEQMVKFEQWINQEIQNPFSKVQVLAATFNVVPSTYTGDNKSVGLECFLCRQTMTVKAENNKKNAKKTVTKHLLQHLIRIHEKQVSKSLIRQFTMDQILKQIIGLKVKKIQIIDRENSGTYVAHENGQFIFQVISQRNISLARGNYVVARSIAKDAADIVISFIIKQLFNLPNMSVRLVTNDHFGTTIQQICAHLGYDFKVISRNNSKK